MRIKIARDFTASPGGRLAKDSKYSGEAFRNGILKPMYLQSKAQKKILIVDLDGGYGYGSAFLEEAFGGLARELKDSGLLDIVLISREEPRLAEEIRGYLRAGLQI